MTRPTNCVVLYFLGRSDGTCIKLGISNDVNGFTRRQKAHAAEAARWGQNYTVLGLLWAMESDEKYLKEYFKAQSLPGGTEYIAAVPEITNWLIWLRNNRWIATIPEELEQTKYVDSGSWLPNKERSTQPPATHDLGLFQSDNQWSWLLDLRTLDVEYHIDKNTIELVRAAMGEITLDVASSAEANLCVRATKFYNENDDGLVQPWHGNVWANPPFEQWNRGGSWAKKAKEEIEKGNINQLAALFSANHITATNSHLLIHLASAICIPKGRIECLTPDGDGGNSQQSRIIFWYGGDQKRLSKIFTDAGWVVFFQ